MTDHSKMKLGKLPPKNDPKLFKLSDYITSALPAAPATLHYEKAIPAGGWGMLGNDTVGDCTIAGIAHMIMSWCAANGIKFVPTVEQVLEVYSAITGYNPHTGANDNGAHLEDVLSYMRKKGIAGHKIGAYAKVNIKNENEVKQAMYLFGGVYIGLALPISAQTGAIWRVEPGSDGEAGSWGGHCVATLGYSKEYPDSITWGEVKKMTWGFWNDYCDEAYAIISEDFLKGNNAPNGFNLQQLQADLAAL